MLDSRYVRFVVETGKSSTIAASKLAGLDRFTIAADDGALDSTAYVVVRDGDDLVMLFADGTRVVIEDYFTSTASFAFDGLGQAVELPLDAQPIGTVGDKALYAFSGDVDGARTILLENRGFTALEPLLDDAAIAALPAGVGLPLMLPLALGLVAAAGGSTAAAVIQTTIKGLFLAGPIIDGNGLSVDIFDNKGNLLARDVPLNEDGSFSVTLEGTYTSVIAILRDGNEADDYRDEATGLPRDLTAQLMSVGTGQPQGDGNTLVNLNINPITTVAARNAGLGQDGTIPEGGLSDAQINDANKATADAFGLSDVNAVAPVNIFDPAFNDTDGDVSESEKYGQILAMMSGLDQKNNGDQQAAIEQIAATLRNAPDADTAQQQVKDNLTEGAVEFEFKNKGGTENEADLLSSPALGIQNTPDVDTEGTSQAPAVTALLDDLASQPDDGDDTPITAAQLQQAVDAANAVQQLVALGAEDAVPAALSETLSEENLELLGLTGLTPAPSPYLGEFLSVLKAAADDGSATDSVAELQALLDGVISAGLTPSQTIEPNADGTITVSGQTVPGASVTVAYPDGTSVTVVADENGAYSATSAAPQTSGNISVSAADSAGNTSAPVVEAYQDETPPVAPTAVLEVNGDGTLSVSGTGEPGSTVTTVFPDGSTGTALVADDGSYGPITSAAAQPSTNVAVTQQDAAGNLSPAAVDETAPFGPSVTEANAAGLSGTAEPGSIVTLFDGGEPPVAIASTTVGEDGSWAIPASDFPGGTTDGFAGSVTATDAAGNVSDPTDVPAIDGTAPAAPGVDAANGDGLSGTGTTDDVIALLDNNGDPVLDGEGNPVTAVVDGDGNWSIPASAFPGGTTEGFAGSVTATDAAGNVSDPTDVPAIDGTAPAAPGVDAANGDGLSGTGTTDDVIALLDNNGDPVLDGEGNPVTAVVDGDGNWSIPASAFPGGTTDGFAGSVTATDAAGNVSDPTTVPAIDGTAPTVTISDDTANTATGDVTFTFTFSEAVTGFSADNLTVTNGTKGTFTAVNSTVYRLVVTPTANSAGDITVATSTTGVTDAAGNTATAPADYVQAFDTAAPTATVDIAATDLNDGANTSDVTITFTEAVTEFDVNDLTITNGTIASVSSSNGGITWTGTFTATDDIEGTGSVELTGAYTDVAGNTGDTGANDTVAIDTRVLTPTINPGITDQANTVSGTGEAGAVVTVNMLEGGLSTLVGTATVWTDGTWSFVAASPIADGAELVATQQDKAGNRSFAAQVTSFTDTDGDGTRDTLDDDDDKDGISDTDEAQRESTVDVTAQTTAASGVNIGTPSTGYVTVDNGSGDQINFVSTTLGESGNDAGLGTQSSVTYDFNTVATEQVTDVTFSIRIDQFDDGLFIKINDTVIVDFNEGSYFIQANGSDLTGIGLNTKFDSGNLAPGETFQRPNVWAAFAGEGRPELVIDVALGTVALLVDLKAGGRENILDDIQDIIDNYDMRNENKVTNPLPGLDFESGVTITTGLNNGTGNALIASQVVTVTGTYAGADDIDGDGIANWLDIDTDNDRIWDKYELSTDTDDDGVADYRDTDSNGASAGTDTSRASLTAAEITALENGGTSSNVVAGVYSNEFNDSIILLSDDGLTLNFGNITDISAAFANAPVEYIDMEDGGNAQTVTLNASDLIALTDANNTLIIIGEAGDTGDTVNASGFEDTGKDISIENKVYDIYQQVGGDATLIIDDDITVNLT